MIGNTCFRKRQIHKYIWERVERGVVVDRAVVDRAVVDYVIVQKLLREW